MFNCLLIVTNDQVLNRKADSQVCPGIFVFLFLNNRGCLILRLVASALTQKRSFINFQGLDSNAFILQHVPIKHENEICYCFEH